MCGGVTGGTLVRDWEVMGTAPGKQVLLPVTRCLSPSINSFL